MMIGDKSFKADGRTYEWGGGYGAVFYSYERGRGIGEVRKIGNRLYYVFSLSESLFSAPRVAWGTVDPPTNELIDSIRTEVFL